jgi:hypothetical protein
MSVFTHLLQNGNLIPVPGMDFMFIDPAANALSKLQLTTI